MRSLSSQTDPSAPLTLHVVARPSILDKLRQKATPVEVKGPTPAGRATGVATEGLASAESAVAAESAEQTAEPIDSSSVQASEMTDEAGSTLPPQPGQTGYSPAYVVPPSSLPEPAAWTSSVPAAAAASTPPVPPVASAIPVLPYTTYISHLQRLLPLQRALLLLNLQKAHAHYTSLLTAGNSEGIEEVERMLKEVGVWTIVEEKVAQREGEWRKMFGDGGGVDEDELVEEEFQIVQVGGLPYLLHTPPDPRHRPSRPALAAVLAHTRTEAIQHCLTTMLQLLLTMSPGVPALAYGRSTASRSAAQPVAAPGAANPNAPDALAAARLAQLGS
ncbi:hypothetical protein Rt10032_c37g6902 [Rhodotorula toruloides]|uniref:Uncharacterized protein n=1 Tax=Rhodotorula toruloides TaxID=5286 RepID=A0A511KSG1_RHOTO|nr:hypothetical protein Rt10032_c37g6902 [Rhodotorula toruloides]